MTVILNKNSELIEAAEAIKKRYLDYQNKFTPSDLLRLLNFISKVQQELRYSQNHKLKIEIALSHLIGLEKTSTITDIINKIDSGQFNSPLLISEQSPAKYPEKKTNNISEQTLRREAPISTSKDKIESVMLSEVSDFDNIVEKWQSFVNSISSERALTFGPIMKNLEPVSLEGSKLNVSGADENGKFLLKQHQEYLSKKALESFGKKIELHFTEPAKTDKKSITKKTSIASPKTSPNNNPIIDAIINELGGQEID